MLDLYDTEVIEIEGVARYLAGRSHSSTNLEGFRQECVDRFESAGFVVQVNVWEMLDPSGSGQQVFGYEFEILDRVTQVEFDPERMAYEVQHNVLGIEQAGTVGADGVIREPKKVL